MDMEWLIQTGTVMDVNAGRHLARVKFREDQSGWLYVLQHTGASVGMEAAEGHAHKASLGEWMPKINDRVLVVYEPVPYGSGFILGVV